MTIIVQIIIADFTITIVVKIIIADFTMIIVVMIIIVTNNAPLLTSHVLLRQNLLKYRLNPLQ